MKSLNFRGIIGSHGQASSVSSCELQHSAFCKLHLVGDEIDFQLATKANTQKINVSTKPVHSVAKTMESDVLQHSKCKYLYRIFY